MIEIKIRWDGEEGKTKFSKDFRESNWVTRADMLVDAMHDLKAEYEKLFEEDRIF